MPREMYVSAFRLPLKLLKCIQLLQATGFQLRSLRLHERAKPRDLKHAKSPIPRFPCVYPQAMRLYGAAVLISNHG